MALPVVSSAVSSRIAFREGELPGARYLSGRVMLDEIFRDGRLCARYWSPSGQVLPEMHLNWHWQVDQPADTFQLAINGQRLEGGYSWVGAEITPDPSAYRGEDRPITHGIITLQHAGARIEVRVHTRTDGGPFLIRWLEITNQSVQSVGITELAPFSGVLWNHRVDEHISLQESPFEAAYAHSYNWGQEGDVYFTPLQPGALRIDGAKTGKSGWGRPAFWARNRCTGQTFVCELAYSGNWQFCLDMRQQDAAQWGRTSIAGRNAQLFFAMGLAGYERVLRVLAPGETVTTPAVHLGLFQHDTNAIIQATHAHVRHTVMPAQIPGFEVEIEANHRGYLCDRENEADLLRDVDVAAEVGTELYVIDAGWYGNEPNQWGNNAGDWFAGPWFPNGLEPVAQHAHARGMRFGLWVEIEASGANSTLKKEHADWLLRHHGEPVNGGRGLDFTNPEVLAWAEAEIARVIEQYHLNMYRIDHNNNLAPSGNRELYGMVEDVMWRYYEAFGALFDRLRARYPHVVFQNCAGGGGRLDWGTLSHFHNTELSDWMRQPRGLKILQGVTLSLPPEVLLRTFGTEMGELELEGDIDAQLRIVCLCRPILRGIAPSLEDLSPFLRERIAHHLTRYREFIRPILCESRVFHHTPFQPLAERTRWCVLEYATQDCSRAVAGIFRTTESDETIYHFLPRGLDRARTYVVTLDNSGQTYRISGHELMHSGIPLRLERPLSSEMVFMQVE